MSTAVRSASEWVISLDWVVSSASSADALVAKLRLSGFTTFSETVTTAGKTVYKVRIGPEIDRDKVSETLAKVRAVHGLNGFVTTQE